MRKGCGINNRASVLHGLIYLASLLFTAHCSAAPVNDAFNDALDLIGFPAQTTGSNVGASKDPGEPNNFTDWLGSYPTTQPVWWKWTSSVTGLVTVVVSQPGTRPIAAVFVGESLPELVQVSTLSFQPPITVDGTNYYSCEARFVASIGSNYTIAVDTQLPLTVAWDPNPTTGTAGYRLHYGSVSHNYRKVLDVGKATTNTFYDLAPGVTNYFAVTAYNDRGVESDFSTEVSAAVPFIGSSAAEFTLSITAPPSIALTNPAAGANFLPSSDLLLEVVATASTGTISRVVYSYIDPVGPGERAEIAVVTSNPFSFLWTNVSAGRYLLTATAVDEFGGSADSTPVPVSVGAPANDHFNDRTELIGLPAAATGSTIAAGKDPDEPDSISGCRTFRTLWWKWTAPSNGMFTVAVTTPNVRPVVAVFGGNSLDALSEQSTFIPAIGVYSEGVIYYTSEARFEATAQTTYAIALDEPDESFTLTITIPPNIRVSSPVPGTDFPIGANILLASLTLDPAEPIDRIEYDYAAGDGRTGVIGVTTNGLFGFMWPNAPFGQYQLTATAIAHSGARTVSTPVVLIVGRPANDDFANRITLIGTSIALSWTNTAATVEPGEPLHAGYDGQHSVWWSWSPPGSANYTVSTVGSSFTTLLDIYVGASISSLTEIASDVYSGAKNTSVASFDAVRGKTYQIAVDGLGGANGRIALKIFPTPAPRNDNFANRIVVSRNASTLSGNNENATSELSEENPFQNSVSKSVWWTWVAPASGLATIDTSGSTFDTLLAIYTGSSFSNLLLIASDDDSGSNLSSRVTFTTKANTAYHIAVDGFEGAAGSILLNINFVQRLLQISNWQVNGFFSFHVAAGDGQSVIIEASSDLRKWIPISTNFIVANFVSFIDTNSINFAHRFYRAAYDFTPPPFAITNAVVQNNQFSLRLSGPEGAYVTIEASTNLQTWTAIANNRITGGMLMISDPTALSSGQRFYRAVRSQ